MKTLYVLGFLFTKDLKKVVLILKNKPEWQKGYLNGIGGKIEKGESAGEAMVREFWEEAGLETDISEWEHFLLIKGKEWEVNCFRSFIPTEGLKLITSKTDESVFIANVFDIPTLKVIPNLNYIIPMCLDFDNFTGEITYEP